ncbi:hypothetical protein [Amycolatopsis anabasis]|uniref:hypothetical protein n=1 Tax=Amycolatopsis anabasis TaxID=1840409 RepID=UPI00131EC591|nr:hypothetical protein [Amycolatopsis anabasis]
MAFNAQWKPGMDAVAGMQKVGPDLAAPVIYLDPDSLALLPPGDPAKWPEFIGLLHQIRAGAAELAEFLER